MRRVQAGQCLVDRSDRHDNAARTVAPTTCGSPSWSKAKLVPLKSYTGEYVVVGDEYIDVDELDSDDPTTPDEAWGTKPQTPMIDPDVLLERLTENYGTEDDGLPELPGWADLVAAVEKFNAVQKPTVWALDRSVRVMIRPSEPT